MPAPISDILQQERKFVRSLRERRGPFQAPGPAGPPREYAPGNPADFAGLALSGGGIRSATFGLGVLEALRELKILTQIDYLSTVSGGGFIGAWLVAGCRAKWSWTQPQPNLADPWHPSIAHLRDKSNYLYPQTGSPYWPMFTIWFRNELLVLSMVLALLGLGLLAPLFLVKAAVVLKTSASWLIWPLALVLIGVPLSGYCRILSRLQHTHKLDRRKGHVRWVKIMIGSLLAGTGLVALRLAQGVAAKDLWPEALMVALLASALVSWVSLRPMSQWRQGPLWGSVLVAAAAIGGALAAYGGVLASALLLRRYQWLVLAGPLLIVTTLWTADAVLSGLLGKKLLDRCREWRGAVHAKSLFAALNVSAWLGVSLLSPSIAAWLYNLAGAALPPITVSWVAASLWGWLKTSRTSSAEAGKRHWIWSYVEMAAPPSLLAAVLVFISLAVHAAVFGTAIFANPATSTLSGWWHVVEHVQWGQLAPVTFALLAVLLVTALCCDLNELGWGNFYRNRIVNCYFGAVKAVTAKGKRYVEELTDLGLGGDDFAMVELANPRRKYSGPLPIVNTTVNLTGSKNPAVRSRRAGSFFFTPLHHGATFAGNAPEARDTPTDCVRPLDPERDTITLGRLVAISGAAVSPNMGAHPVSKFAFMLTLLNARLGWWMRNPASGKPHSFLPWYLLKELFADTDASSNYLYLSDGGHFENLGVYELLRRSCGVIIVSDAEEDPNMAMNSLAALIRLAKVDLGAELQGDLSQLAKRSDGSNQVRSHWAAFTINYKPVRTPHVERETGSFGYLIYLKSSLTGDEPPEVLNYARQSPAFPHESTGNQFFSEAQFESYRDLGYHVGMSAFKAFRDLTSIHRIAEDLAWRAASKLENESGDLTDRLSELTTELQSDPLLAFLVAQLHPGWPAPGVTPPPENMAFARAFLFCQRLLMFAEEAHARLDLDRHHSSPGGIAWTHLFEGWMKSHMVRIAWNLTFQSYGFFFNEFVTKRLGMPRLEFELEPRGVAVGEVRGRFALKLMGPEGLAPIVVGTAATIGRQVTRFSQVERFGLTCVAATMRDKLHKLGVTAVHPSFQLDPADARRGRTKEEFVAWWAFPSDNR